MTEEEVEIVAEELAKIGGTAWYPGRGKGPLLRLVTDRYREQARAVIAAIDRMRTSHTHAVSPEDQDQARRPRHGGDEFRTSGAGQGIHPQDVQPGATVIYRPPGDRRAYPCRVVEIRGSRAYLAPILKTCIGWISIENLQGLPEGEDSGKI